MNDKQTAIVPLDIEPPAKPEPKPQELIQVEARTISKFAEASMIDYTDEERRILFAPINVADIKVRPDGQIYLEWAWYAERLDQAFGQGQWSLSPSPWNPRLYREMNITYREYVLWIRSSFVANAVGHHEEQRKTANFGDAAEATYANALVRCCKHIGMARDLWKKDKIDEFKKQLKTKGPADAEKAAGAVFSPPMTKQDQTAAPPQTPGALLEKANSVCNSFHCDYQIGQQRLETFLKRDKMKWNEADIDVLRGLYKKLRKGASAEEIFTQEAN